MKVKFIINGYGIGVNVYKNLDHMSRIFFYRILFILKEVTHYPTLMQLGEDEKKLVFHLPPRMKKDPNTKETL